MSRTEEHDATSQQPTVKPEPRPAARSGKAAADDARRQQSEEQARTLAERFRLKYVDLRDPSVKIDYALVERLPVDFLVRNQVVPLEPQDGLQPFAVADP